ncbi:hypothetical protein AB0M37_04280 [Micromonospora chalcea]
MTDAQQTCPGGDTVSATRDTTGPVNPDAQAAARALLAVLDHSEVTTKVDERLFEALLAYGLQSIPGLGSALFSCGSDVAFDLGQRGGQADIVGYQNHELVVECEVKLHSNIHWPQGRCQLDNYADFAPANAQLFLLTAQNRLAKIEKELREVRSGQRWTVLHDRTLREAVAQAAGPLPVGDGSAERLIYALARLVDTEAQDLA